MVSGFILYYCIFKRTGPMNQWCICSNLSFHFIEGKCYLTIWLLAPTICFLHELLFNLKYSLQCQCSGCLWRMHVVFIIVTLTLKTIRLQTNKELLERQYVFRINPAKYENRESWVSGEAMQWKYFSLQQMTNIFIRIGCV